jgi:hypothetical protein
VTRWRETTTIGRITSDGARLIALFLFFMGSHPVLSFFFE